MTDVGSCGLTFAPDGTRITLRCGRCGLILGITPTRAEATVGEAVTRAIGDNDWSVMEWTDKKFVRGRPTVVQHRLICKGCHTDLVQWARNEDVVSRETGGV